MKKTYFLLLVTLLLAPPTAWAFGDWFTQLAALEAAAARGDPEAMVQLAQKHEHGEGVSKDFQVANALYCKAAKAGNAEGQFKLGWIYANGRGVERDDGVAAALFAMAAQQGHEYANKLLEYVRQHTIRSCPPACCPIRRCRWQSRKGAAPRDRSEIEQLVHRLAPQYAVDPNLVLAVISAESAFNPKAVSPKNAQGLMQLIPETAERFGVKQAFSPTENIKGGLAYLRWLLAFFQGDVPLVLAAYNAGERAVEKYRGIPPYPETRNYVRKITSVYKRALHPFEPGVVEPSLIMVRSRSALR